MTPDRPLPRSPGMGAGEEVAETGSSPAPAPAGPSFDGEAAGASPARSPQEQAPSQERAAQQLKPAAGGRAAGEPPQEVAHEEAAAGQPPAEEPFAETGPAEAAPAEEPFAEAPAEEPSAEAAPAEAALAEEAEGQQLERDLDELAAKAQKADEYLELAQRTRADFENYRKRAARESAAAQQRGVAKLARELLPALDNLERALAAAREAGDGADLAAGIELVHADVIAALGRVGIEPYSPEGEPFDPERHEAVAQQPVEGAEPGTVVEVYQRGYRHGERVLRPARVLVAG